MTAEQSFVLTIIATVIGNVAAAVVLAALQL